MTSTMVDRILRESVGAIFGIDGSELDPAPYSYAHESGMCEGTFRFTFDGAPEWCMSDFSAVGPDAPDQYEYFTAIGCIWGFPPDVITVRGKRYGVAGLFGSSGETECVAKGLEHDPFAGQICPLCERAPGKAHGFIRLADGWTEVVYRHNRME